MALISVFTIYGCITNLQTEQLPVTIDSSVCRTLHRYRKAHGSESHSCMNNFQPSVFQLPKISWVYKYDGVTELSGAQW